MMKSYLLLIAIVLTTLTSCTFTENITLNDNGTGEYSLDMDGTALMAMAGDQMGSEANNKNIDSTFAFKDIFREHKDSIAKLSPEEQRELKKLENFVVHMRMNAEQKEFLINLKTDFKSVNELQDMMKSISAIQNIDKNHKEATENPFKGGFADNKASLAYTYDAKKFTRKSTVNKADVKEIEEDSLGMYKMIFASSTYKLNYHFPKRVKKVSNEKAMFSEDRKTITVEYPFTEYMEEPTKLDLIVEFE